MADGMPAPTIQPTDEIARLYHFLAHEDYGVTEVRVIDPNASGPGIRGIGFFDNEADFVRVVSQWDKTTSYNLYVGLNPRDLALFDSAPNGIRAGVKGADAGDITRAMHIGIDVDPERPKGQAATEEELQEALRVRDAVAQWARDQGFSPALLGMSGNGGHLIFSIPPTAPDEIAEHLRAFVQTLKREFSSPKVKIDSTYDLPRIWKIYGTLSRKGANTSDRPWRRARIDAVNPGPNPRLLEYLLRLDVANPAGVSPEVQGGTPRPPDASGLEHARKHCLFIQHCRDHAATLPEPLWYAMVTNLARFPGGPEAIHEFSRPYAKYSPRETDSKIKHAQESQTGPHTCAWLADNGFPCPELGRCPAKAPSGLGIRLARQAATREAVDKLLADLEASREGGKQGNFMLAYDRVQILAPLNKIEYEKVRAKIKTLAPKIRLLELDRLVRSHRARWLEDHQDDDLEAEDASRLTKVKAVLPDAPVPGHLVIPAEWELTEISTSGVRAGKNQYGEFVTLRIPVCPAPLLITRRLSNLDTYQEQLCLAFSRDGVWKQDIYDRRVLLNHRNLTDIANSGLPVNSINAKEIVKYLADFEAANLGDLPVDAVVSSLGWKEHQGRRCFVLGETIVGAPATEEDTEPWIQFSPESPGDTQLVGALGHRGTLDRWLSIARTLQNYPRAMLGLYASFVPPLLPIVQAPNFILDYCGLTSQGKTTVEEIAASVWGLPTKERGGLVQAWDSTKVFAERYAALFNHLPIFLDDSQTADSRLVSRMLYMVANGIGKGRGAVKGLRKTSSWSTVCFSTGEHRLVDTTEDEGARARTITLWGSPFGAGNQGNRVREIKTAVQNNYGHAGPAFVKYLLDHQDEWDSLRTAYEAQVKALSTAHPGNVADRLSQYFAAITVAAIIFDGLFGLETTKSSDVIRGCFDDVLVEMSRGDSAQRALQLVVSWARSNIFSFFGSSLETIDDKIAPSENNVAKTTEFCGVWREGEYIAIFPHRVREILERNKFTYESVIRAWAERGYLKKGPDSFVFPIRFNRSVQRMVVLNWSSVDSN